MENDIIRYYPKKKIPTSYTNRDIKECQKYNFKVDKIIYEINLLKKWPDYIIFKGIKYGLPSVCNGIHRENDCCGKIIKDCQYEKCDCHLCEDWGGCNQRLIKNCYYICDKCGYTYSTHSRE